MGVRAARYRHRMMDEARSVGAMIREWRQRRRLSQLELACDAEISTRHLSFVETGRSLPSRAMVLRLAERLEVPLRERNVLLTAAGYAPSFRERPLEDPELRAAHETIQALLKAHEPCPALAIDRHWTMVAWNRAVAPFLEVKRPELIKPPMNAMRITLHPDGLAPRIANYLEWREHALTRLRRQIDLTADPILIDLLEELRGYPVLETAHPAARANPHTAHHRVAIPFQFMTEAGVLSFFSTTTIFGTPIDITLSELALETFFPADPATAQALRRMADGWRQ